MGTKQKTHSVEFKAKVALEAIRADLTANQITSKYGVHTTQIHRWKQQALEAVKNAFAGKKGSGQKTDQQLIEQLYMQIGQMKVELDFLKKSVWE